MKKLINDFLVLLVLFSFVGCSTQQSTQQSTKKTSNQLNTDLNSEEGRSNFIAIDNLRKGTERFKADDYDGAIPLLEDAYRGAHNQEMRLVILNCLGLAYKETGNYSEAIRCFNEIIESDKVLAQNSEIVEMAHLNLGSIYFLQGDIDRAKDKIEFTLAICQSPRVREICKSLQDVINNDQAKLLHKFVSVQNNPQSSYSEDFYILKFRSFITDLINEKGISDESEHLKDFFFSVATVEEACIKAIQENNKLAIALLMEGALNSIERIDLTVLDQALKVIKEQCNSITNPKDLPLVVVFAMKVVLKTGKEAIPRLQQDSDNPCIMALIKIIQES
ncbi:MAG: tetratricopeptide repeat protein [bacterium]